MRLRRSVELCIFRLDASGEYQLLMSRRGPTKHGAGAFAIPGGHLDRNRGRWETYSEAAVREVREELGEALAIAVQKAFEEDRVAVVAIADDIRDKAEPQIHYIHVTLAIEVPHGIEADTSAQDSIVEHVGIAWVAEDDVRQLLDQNKIYISQYAQIRYFLDGKSRYTQLDGLI